MLVDVNKLKSHPEKPLFRHVDGVVENVKKLTKLKFSELAAIFHDLGKINPNFQLKLEGIKTTEYSNHAYLSAFSFFCAFSQNKENRMLLNNWIGYVLTANDFIALSIIIAKHHGNIPDFIPTDFDGSGASILDRNENQQLFKFLDDNQNVPIEEYAKQYFPKVVSFNDILLNNKVRSGYLDRLIFNQKTNNQPLDFYLNTQFSFASLVQADKVDAAMFDNFININNRNIKTFCNNYFEILNSYISKLNQDSEINKLRTTIRLDALNNIKKGLEENVSVFELTAPTGSGKTLMMLSLAAEIIRKKGAKRIIYALPFLSITEQVEAEALKIFKDQKQYIQRIDSKSQNEAFEILQNELEKNPTKENLKKINLFEFKENSFAYPFIITTFVRFFETLLSNRNSDLLKLPNFSNSIFLIDEVQALPPRLYTFFTAYLSRFCEKNDSFAIISTATQPNFSLPDKPNFIRDFFSNYLCPYKLLSLEYFENELFNRYQIKIDNKGVDIEELKNTIAESKKSTLVILNTIDDTKDLYSLLVDAGITNKEVLLLNTHITPRHRKIKIYLAKRRLRENKKVILISTQLIEAGVDIDFPEIYRDLTTISSIVQSAGRCNRNGKLKEKGIVHLTRFKKNGQFRANLIYGKKDKELLNFTTQALRQEIYQEKELINVQKEFFDRILGELNFGQHSQTNPELYIDFIMDIKEAKFNKIGQFQLIDKGKYGEELQFYIPKNNKDLSFILLNEYSENMEQLFENKPIDWNEIGVVKNKINILKRKMSENIVQIRLKHNQLKPIITNKTKNESLFEISQNSYSYYEGICLKGEEFIL